MASKKAAAKKQTRPPSSGSDPKSKGIVKKKMQETMDEFKHHQLQSGRSGKKVKNPKQAIAIGLSEARHAGADIPPAPSRARTPDQKKSSTAKKAASRKQSNAKPAKAAKSKHSSKKTAPSSKLGR